MKQEAANDRLIYLFRHGETEWSRSGRHTGRSDVALTAHGRQQARALAGLFASTTFELILCSPRQRAIDTAEIAELWGRFEVAEELSEWDYGDYEGRTTEQIRRTVPDWSVWTHPCPGGETIAQVAARADAVLNRVARCQGHCALISHAHFLRVFAARWLGEAPELGRHLVLSTASVSVLGFEREEHVVKTWNLVPTPSEAPRPPKMSP